MNFDSEERSAVRVPRRKVLLTNSGAHMYICGKIKEEFSVSGGITKTGAGRGLRFSGTLLTTWKSKARRKHDTAP
jgi:hypothetical protein